MSGRWSRSRSSAMQQSPAVAVAITFMVLTPVKKLITTSCGGFCLCQEMLEPATT
jgi:hypothetical protein